MLPNVKESEWSVTGWVYDLNTSILYTMRFDPKKGVNIMKMLVCIDGSEQSLHALGKAYEIASQCGVNEVALLHVYENIKRSYWLSTDEGYSPSEKELERIENVEDQVIAKKKEMLLKAAHKFESNGIVVEKKLLQGHVSHTIIREADDGNYDMIVIGSRGLGGLKKIFLGSVSNAVLQEAHCSVLVVK